MAYAAGRSWRLRISLTHWSHLEQGWCECGSGSRASRSRNCGGRILICNDCLFSGHLRIGLQHPLPMGGPDQASQEDGADRRAGGVCRSLRRPGVHVLPVVTFRTRCLFAMGSHALISQPSRIIFQLIAAQQSGLSAVPGKLPQGPTGIKEDQVRVQTRYLTIPITAHPPAYMLCDSRVHSRAVDRPGAAAGSWLPATRRVQLLIDYATGTTTACATSASRRVLNECTVGTMFLSVMFLGDQIDEYGIGTASALAHHQVARIGRPYPVNPPRPPVRVDRTVSLTFKKSLFHTLWGPRDSGTSELREAFVGGDGARCVLRRCASGRSLCSSPSTQGNRRRCPRPNRLNTSAAAAPPGVRRRDPCPQFRVAAQEVNQAARRIARVYLWPALGSIRAHSNPVPSFISQICPPGVSSGAGGGPNIGANLQRGSGWLYNVLYIALIYFLLSATSGPPLNFTRRTWPTT